MRYQVPQFIEIEDKIFGPLTLKQFIYLGGAAGLCLVFFTLLPTYIAFICAIPFVALGVGLAFYQVNGRPLIVAIEHAMGYLLGSKLYLWKQRIAAPAGEPKARPAATIGGPGGAVPKLTESKLKDLAWSLNIKDRSAGSGGEDGPMGGFAI